MDDLRQLAMLLAKPEPSGDVIDRAATAVVLATGLLTPGGTARTETRTALPGAHSRGPAPAHPAVALSPARKLLLAAAAAVLKQHPGAYWHFKIKINPIPGAEPVPKSVTNTDESWIARDGRYWNAQPRCAAPPGTAVFEGPGLAGFGFGNIELTYQVARRLPTDPAALAAWFAKHNPHGKYGVTFVADALITLEWEVPAPPRVRAAAFQALAALPGVKSLGPVKGGVGLLITFPHAPAGSWIKIVIDPAVSLVRSEGDAKGGVTVIQKAEWTNRLPRIIPLPPKNACGT